MSQARIPRVVICGAVDDGKSTLIGRLLTETGSVPLDELASATASTGEIDYAALTDGLISEQEQGITIDVAYRYLSLPTGQRFLLADSPGHEQYTRNMAVAAASASIAIIVVDLVQGVREQTIRHATVCHLMGVRTFIFALNKTDALEKATVQNAVDVAQREILRRVPVLASDDPRMRVQFLPVSALHGEMTSLVSELAKTERELSRHPLPTRLPVQLSVKKGTTRFYSGQLRGDALSVGDPVILWPSGVQTTVSEIFVADRPQTSAHDGDAVALSLSVDVDVSRGDIITLDTGEPETHSSRAHLADLVWLDTKPLNLHASYLLRCGPTSVPVHVSDLRFGYDLEGGTHARINGMQANDIARVEIMTHLPLLLDTYETSHSTGGFILCDRATGDTVAAGMSIEALTRESDVTKHDFAITRDVREQFNGVRGGVLWLTGLSGSGKSTIADLLEAQLLELGIRSYVLDGDSVRHSLSEDLGFSPEDRAENIRRVAHVAHMFMDAGVIAIVSLVSPFASDRAAARALFADDDFAEVFVDTPIQVCEERDTKGLYARARASNSTQMTGIGQNYEAPTAAEFHLDGLATPENNARVLRDWVLSRRIPRS